MPQIPGSMTALIINLARDEDRFRSITAILRNEPSFNLVRISAVDGSELPVAARQTLSSNERWATRAGEIGCFLSHSKAWEHVASSTQRFCIILEDDAVPFNLGRLAVTSLPADFDLIFINDRMSGGSRSDRPDLSVSFVPIEDCLVSLAERPKGVGGDGYILSPEGARKLLAAVKKDLFYGHVDWRLLRYCVAPENLSRLAGSQFASVIRNHHNPNLGPAWGILKGFCSNTPLIHYGLPGSSARERATSMAATSGN